MPQSLLFDYKTFWIVQDRLSQPYVGDGAGIARLDDVRELMKACESHLRLFSEAAVRELNVMAASAEDARYRCIIKSTVPSKGYVYLFKNLNGFYKIGFSKEPKVREYTLQSQEPGIEMLKAWEGTRLLEKRLHRRFADKRVRGEWFRLTEEDVKSLLKLKN